MRRRRPDIAGKIRRRITALKANSNLDELRKNDPLGKWHRLSGDREGQWAGKLSSNERIILEPREDGIEIIGLKEGLRATEANIVDITDYH